MPDMFPLQKFSIGPISATDRKGNPAQFQGDPVFTSDTDGVATVEVDPSDPKKGIVKSVSVGGAQIKVTVDADLGDGVKELSGFVGVNVTPEGAVALVVPEGPVEDQ